MKSNTNSIRENLGIDLKIYLRTNANAYETKLGMHLKTYAHTNTNNKKNFLVSISRNTRQAMLGACQSLVMRGIWLFTLGFFLMRLLNF